MKEKKSCFIGLKVEKELFEHLHNYAASADSSASRIARIAIKKYLKDQQKTASNGQ